MGLSELVITEDEEIAELLKDYETPGCSKREIGEHYGISTSSVYRLYYENMLALSA
jgi:transposase